MSPLWLATTTSAVSAIFFFLAAIKSGNPTLVTLGSTLAMSISLWGWSEFQLRRISLLIVAKGYLLSAAKAHYREAVFISWMCFCFGISHPSITLRLERTWFVAAPGKSSYGVWISWQVDPGLFLITTGFWVLSAALLFFIGIASCIRINTLIRNPELEVDRYFG